LWNPSRITRVSSARCSSMPVAVIVSTQ
jgi:hypothetical protein